MQRAAVASPAFSVFIRGALVPSLIYLLIFLAQAHAEEEKRFLSATYRVLAGPGMIKTTCNPHLEGISL